jgi:two-component system response regulator YesN
MMFTTIMVDDEPWALSGLKGIVSWEDEGFFILKCCTDPFEALDLLRHIPIDAVFTDIRMPALSGLDMMKLSREENSTCEFIFVSAYSDFENARQAIKQGVFDYILKPLRKEEILQVTRRLRAFLTQKSQRNDVLSSLPENSDLRAPDGEYCFVMLTCTSTIMNIPDVTVHSCTKIDGAITTTLSIAQDRVPELIQWREETCVNGISVGMSTAHKNFGNLDNMMREAEHSLKGNFFYSQNAMIACVQEYIASQYREDLSLGQIAQHFNITECYLCDLFKKHTGQTIIMFITRMRMEQAGRLLRGTDLTVADISDAVGYMDHAYFGRVFKSYFGMPPSQYRSSFGMTSSTTV